MIEIWDMERILNKEKKKERMKEIEEEWKGEEVRFILIDEEEDGRINMKDRRNKEKDCGWIVIGMGKLGEREIKYY